MGRMGERGKRGVAGSGMRRGDLERNNDDK